MISNNIYSSPSLIFHLQPYLWDESNAFHFREIITSEFAHELLIEPKLQRIEHGRGIIF